MSAVEPKPIIYEEFAGAPAPLNGDPGSDPRIFKNCNGFSFIKFAPSSGVRSRKDEKDSSLTTTSLRRKSAFCLGVKLPCEKNAANSRSKTGGIKAPKRWFSIFMVLIISA
ncbi:hypothetical protein [Kocuria tytonicola]|uniref:hypothetical protein n=1 Tax=Kocuria tytonicola TaxID=2055946 RepID=UPI001403AE2B|nr:hypothetical protein [Kocuria tytonicola]